MSEKVNEKVEVVILCPACNGTQGITIILDFNTGNPIKGRCPYCKDGKRTATLAEGELERLTKDVQDKMFHAEDVDKIVEAKLADLRAEVAKDLESILLLKGSITLWQVQTEDLIRKYQQKGQK